MEPRSPGKETFGTCLLKSVPKITTRHQEELKVLEALHQHMSKRVKADTDYAEQLSKINQSSLKACSKDAKGELSSILQIWSSFLQATDKVISKIQQSAQHMKSLLTTELQPLIKNKRGACVVFNKDRVNAENDYTSSSNEVDTLHQSYKEYAKNANKYRKKAKKPKSDKVVQQYLSHSSQLHNCHNSYVLAIQNANTHQHYYKTTILPLILDTFQERMELHVGEWKCVMEKYTRHLNLQEVYGSANDMIVMALSGIDPATEYHSFIQQNKSKEGLKVVSYDFDASVAKLPIVRVANPGIIAVNNLTLTPLKEKLSNLQMTLDDVKRRADEKTTEIESLRKDLGGGNNINKQKLKWFDNERVQQLTVRCSILQEEVATLRCKEGRCQEQADSIQQAVDRAVPPFPSFDPAIGDIDVDLLAPQDLISSGSGGSTTLKGKLIHIFGKSSRHTPSSSPSVHPRSNSTSIPQSSSSGGACNDGSGDEDDEVDVEDEPWYYGDIPREDTHQMIKQDGDYLIRYSANKSCYVATTKCDGIVKHFAIQKLEDETFRFEGTSFPSIAKLLIHYQEHRIPVTKRSQAVLLKPICKIKLADDKYTMKHSDITLDTKPLGKGMFGEVYCGTLKATGRRVAVKTCRSEHIPAAQQFLAEAEILKQYDHPNIVRLLGVCSDKEPVYIVMELMPGGDFLHFLRTQGINQTVYQLTKFGLDAAQGMEYLASKNCIHRDLAARNCLIGDNNEILKISDFGMSRETDDDNIYLQSSGCKPVPVKWTAPESLQLGQYTSASDVWSYGILLFETYSCGSSPYPGMSNNAAREQVEQGYRMPAPEGTPTDVYDKVMWECWYYEPDERPSFTDVVATLKGILAKLPRNK